MTNPKNHPNRAAPAIDKLCRHAMATLDAREIRLTFKDDTWWACAVPSMAAARNRALTNPKLDGQPAEVVNEAIEREAERIIGKARKGKTPEEAIAALIA